MELQNNFTILNILLLQSEFKRTLDVNSDSSLLKTPIHIDINLDIKDNIINVKEVFTFKSIHNGVEQVSCRIEMLGVFQANCSNDNNIYEKFGQINGPAIIYPYIRETFSSLCMKAGLIGIYLSPMNFTSYKPQHK